MRLLMTMASAALFAAPLVAQAPDSTAEAARRRIDALLRLPQRVEELKRAGVPDTAVRGVLDVLKREKVGAEESEAVLVAQRDAANEHGPTDNFGAFVQARLASGLRGKDLADAIRAEHRARGKGRPADAGAKGKAPDDGAKGKAPEGAGAKGKAPDAAGAKGKAPEAPTKGKSPDAAGNSRRPPR